MYEEEIQVSPVWSFKAHLQKVEQLVLKGKVIITTQAQHSELSLNKSGATTLKIR